jgi:di/tripeptidase
MMNVGFIQNGNNVKTVHKNNNNACVRDMQNLMVMNGVYSYGNNVKQVIKTTTMSVYAICRSSIL